MTSSVSLHVLNNQLDQALSLAQHGVELAPDNPRTQDTLAWGLLPPRQLHSRYGVPEESREPRARRAPPVSSGFSLLKNGQATLASTQMEAALQKDPDLPKKDRGGKRAPLTSIANCNTIIAICDKADLRNSSLLWGTPGRQTAYR